MNDYTRNSDMTYWDIPRKHSNCGSYALNVQEWVVPVDDDEYDHDTRDDIMYGVWEATEDEKETADALAARDWEQILRDFPYLRPIPHPTAVPDDVEVIAYRVGIAYDESADYLDEDFHFRVRRNGVWYEKHGTQEPHECYCQFVEGEWTTPTGDLVYNSDTYYAAIEV